MAEPRHSEGFTYTHLGDIGGEQRQDMRHREIGWWRDWLSCGPVYSQQPYAQPAGVLAAASNSEGPPTSASSPENVSALGFCEGAPGSGAPVRMKGRRRNGSDFTAVGAWFTMAAQQVFVGYGITVAQFRCRRRQRSRRLTGRAPDLGGGC